MSLLNVPSTPVSSCLLTVYFDTDATDWNQTKPVCASALGWTVWLSGRSDSKHTHRQEELRVRPCQAVHSWTHPSPAGGPPSHPRTSTASSSGQRGSSCTQLSVGPHHATSTTSTQGPDRTRVSQTTRRRTPAQSSLAAVLPTIKPRLGAGSWSHQRIVHASHLRDETCRFSTKQQSTHGRQHKSTPFPSLVVFLTMHDKLLFAFGQRALLVSVFVFFFLRRSQVVVLTQCDFCAVLRMSTW